MQRAANGVFEYRKPIFQCKADIEKLIAKKIEYDPSGTFDVIKFLKDRRNTEHKIEGE